MESSCELKNKRKVDDNDDNIIEKPQQKIRALDEKEFTDPSQYLEGSYSIKITYNDFKGFTASEECSKDDMNYKKLHSKFIFIDNEYYYYHNNIFTSAWKFFLRLALIERKLKHKTEEDEQELFDLKFFILMLYKNNIWPKLADIKTFLWLFQIEQSSLDYYPPKRAILDFLKRWGSFNNLDENYYHRFTRIGLDFMHNVKIDSHTADKILRKLSDGYYILRAVEMDQKNDDYTFKRNFAYAFAISYRFEGKVHHHKLYRDRKLKNEYSILYVKTISKSMMDFRDNAILERCKYPLDLNLEKYQV